MNKPILMATAAILALAVPFTPANAATDYDRRSDDELSTTSASGVYVGGFGGYSWTDAEIEGGPDDLDVNGGDYGLFIGYQLDTFLDRSLGIGMGAAIEAHYAWSTADDDVPAGEFEKNNEWGISLRPGISFLNYEPLGFRPYGIIGYRNAEFDSSIAGVSEENLDGLELGIGTELVAWKNYGVRLDYSHVFYGEEGDIDADEDNLRLGVAYHF
jgi:hypothetical protein